MTSRIEFNPQLCEMSAKRLDLRQRNLILAFLPYLGTPLSHCTTWGTRLAATRSSEFSLKTAWIPLRLEEERCPGRPS